MRRVLDGELDEFLKSGKTSRPLAAFAADLAFDALDMIAEVDQKTKLLERMAKKYGPIPEGRDDRES